MPESPPWWHLFEVKEADVYDACAVLCELYSQPRAQHVPLIRPPPGTEAACLPAGAKSPMSAQVSAGVLAAGGLIHLVACQPVAFILRCSAGLVTARESPPWLGYGPMLCLRLMCTSGGVVAYSATDPQASSSCCRQHRSALLPLRQCQRLGHKHRSRHLLPNRHAVRARRPQ